jgi:hypothetical protein
MEDANNKTLSQDNLTMPQDLYESLKAISGERPESFKREFVPNVEPYPGLKEYLGRESAQEEFLKKKDPVEIKYKFVDNKTEVFDLTEPADSEKHSQLLNLISDPESGVVLAEELKEPQIMLDPTARRGYRAIVFVRTTRPVKYLKKKEAGYSVVGKEDVKKE